MNPMDGVHEFSAYSGDEDFHCDQCDCAKEIGEDERGFQFLYCKKCQEAEEEFYMSHWTDTMPKSF